MWTDDINFPSVEDTEADIEQEIPEEDREWSEWFYDRTLDSKPPQGGTVGTHS